MIKIKQISPHIRRVTCPNPSKFTFKGTNCFIIGQNRLTIVDPGPIIEGFIPQLVAALKPAKITHILITHSHRDHSPAAAELKALTGAKTYASGQHNIYRTDIDNPFKNSGDWDFEPDIILKDNQTFNCDNHTFKAIQTDGHCYNHMAYALTHIDKNPTQDDENCLFVGDHIMGWASTIVAPPDGNMSRYMHNLYKLQTAPYNVFYSAHGAAITKPKTRIDELIKHRLSREAEIVDCLKQGIGDIVEMVKINYPKLDQALIGPAAMSTLAQLEWLIDKNMVVSDAGLTIDAQYRLANEAKNTIYS
ncbi:MAG: MBL fold metallo-hydrolase [Hyphomicrobiales bacterium]|nr:MAG: MBL fold metallo-hydrolase [Hyphomicrobiales bacterium]